MSQLVHMFRASHLGSRRPAYDGRKSLYTAGQLPFESKEFIVKLVENDGQANRCRVCLRSPPLLCEFAYF